MIDLIYDEDCPNIELARSQLRKALTNCGRPLDWNEYASSNPDLPAYARGYGSPTILIDGEDVGGEAPQHAPCCRIYAPSDGRADHCCVRGKNPGPWGKNKVRNRHTGN